MIGKIRNFVKPIRLIDHSMVQFHGADAGDLLYNVLESGKPVLISRLGSEELKTLKEYRLRNRVLPVRMYYYMKRQVKDWRVFSKNGIFDSTIKPQSTEMVGEYYKEFMMALPEVDILGSWLYWERIFIHELKAVKKVRLRDLEPYYHYKPWTRLLKGKKVLVIHPMKSTILEQFQNRHLIYPPHYTMPDFDLTVLEAKYFDDPEYPSWTDLFEYYKREVKLIDFDIAIIGNGSWGLPVGAFIKKELNKTAIHLGGATQLLFGIIGERWLTQYPRMNNFINEYWTSPNAQETPEWAKSYDSNAYWK